jgi:hypothetical protein
MNLAERCNEHQQSWKRAKLGYIDAKNLIEFWILHSSIGHDPLIYIVGLSYSSRKQVQNVFSMFPMQKYIKNRFGK